MVRTIMIAVVALAVMLSACRAEAPGDEGRPEASGLAAASQGLCDAQVLVEEGNVRGAAEVFDAETHDYLHELAAVLQEVDPEAAAGLLEAKQQVEGAFRGARDPVAVQGLLLGLQRAFHDAAEAAELPEPLCREGAL